MSNYLGKANNPNTGNLEDCEFLDDFYGKRQYAVRFKDGTTYPESEVEGLPINEHKHEPWVESLMALNCINGAMYFGSVEDDTCNCKTRCQNEQTFQHATEEMVGFIRTLLADQNTANAERIRGLKIVPTSTPHGSPYITGVNETAEAAAKLVEKQI